MSLMKYVVLTCVLLSASSAAAGEIRDRSLIGTWRPVAADAPYADWTVLVFSGDDRFAAIVGRHAKTARTEEVPDAGGALPLPVSGAALSRTATSGLVALEDLDAASGSWMLGEDGGEVVLAFDSRTAKEVPGTTLYVQMLLLDDQLHPYPGMAGRSPVAATTWHRVDEAVAGDSGDGPLQ